MKGKKVETNSPLRKIRERAGLSQTDLARALGVTQVHISRLEIGTSSIEKANVTKLYELAKILGCRIEDLIGRERL